MIRKHSDTISKSTAIEKELYNAPVTMLSGSIAKNTSTKRMCTCPNSRIQRNLQVLLSTTVTFEIMLRRLVCNSLRFSFSKYECQNAVYTVIYLRQIFIGYKCEMSTQNLFEFVLIEFSVSAPAVAYDRSCMHTIFSDCGFHYMQKYCILRIAL